MKCEKKCQANIYSTAGQRTLVNIWCVPMYTTQCWKYPLSISTKSPTSNVPRTVLLCWLTSSTILSYTCCKNKQGSGFNIQQNLSISITLLTNNFTLYKYSFHTEITFMKTYHKNDCEMLLFNKNTFQCVDMQMFSRNTLWNKIKIAEQGSFWTKDSYWLSWSHHFERFTVATLTCLADVEYRCHKWPRICSTWCKHFPVLSSFMTYHWVP